MQITLAALRDGLRDTETMEKSREDMEQAGIRMTDFLVQNERTRNYLFFMAALDAMRSYVGGAKLTPKSYHYAHTQALSKKMEELDTLIAGSRAGLPDGVDNQFIISELRESLCLFAATLSNSLKFPSDAFVFGTEEAELLRALDGMYRHFGLEDQKDWLALRGAVKLMGTPVPMEDRLLDARKMHWTSKQAFFKAQKDRRLAMAETENGAATLLLNSRQAALEDDARQQNGEAPRSSEQARPYLLVYSLVDALTAYYHKYQDEMGEDDSKSLKRILGDVLLLDDTLAGADSLPEGATKIPDAKDVQDIITKDLWPDVVRFFGKRAPDSRIPADDSRLLRLLYELQDTLGLPEQTEDGDMRPVYNFVQDPDKRERIWSKALSTAQSSWKKNREDRTAQAKADLLKAEQEEADRLQAQPEDDQLDAQPEDDLLQADLEETARKKAEEEEAARRKVEEEEAALQKAQSEDNQSNLQPQDDLLDLQPEDDLLKTDLEEAERKESSQQAEENHKLKGEASAQQPDENRERKSEEEEVQELVREYEQRRKDGKMAPKPVTKEKVEEKRLEPPSEEGKTWEQFKKELDAYLTQNVPLFSDLKPDNPNPTPEDIPHIRQLAQYFVAAGRFGTDDLEANKDKCQALEKETVDSEELYRETMTLLNDPGFLKLLKEKEFRQKMSGRLVTVFWRHVKEESIQEHSRLNKDSPYIYDVIKTREMRRVALEKKNAPLKKTISDIYTRLTDPRYNEEVRKTGFLFFQPSNTGLYQAAVDSLATVNQAADPRNSDKTAAITALRAYLDDRMGVRRHEYGRQRWVKLMCAYKALETPEQFAAYCQRVNAYRGIKDEDVANVNFVHPSAFGPERVDLEKPRIPMNEALQNLRQDYAKAAAAKDEKALQHYFARVSAMRTEAIVSGHGGDMGALIDMDQVNEKAQTLEQDPSFLTTFKTGDRRALLYKAKDILYPEKKWGPGVSEQEEFVPNQAVDKKTNGLSKE